MWLARAIQNEVAGPDAELHKDRLYNIYLKRILAWHKDSLMVADVNQWHASLTVLQVVQLLWSTNHSVDYNEYLALKQKHNSSFPTETCAWTVQWKYTKELLANSRESGPGTLRTVKIQKLFVLGMFAFRLLNVWKSFRVHYPSHQNSLRLFGNWFCYQAIFKLSIFRDSFDIDLFAEDLPA